MIVVYHKACRDGFAAAWAIRTVYPDATFIAANYGQPIKGFPFNGEDVIFADFSLPRAEMIAIAEKAASLRVFDHHKTAEEALRDFPASPGVKIVFDMERSGAGIAWDELHDHAGAHLDPKAPSRPWFINYVEDRDLWRFRLSDSHAVNAYLGTLQFAFPNWDSLANVTVEEAGRYGSFIQAKTEAYVTEVCKNSYARSYGGMPIRVVNAPQVDISEVLADLLAQYPDADFSAGWWMRSDGLIQVGLRSRPSEKCDVSEIAKAHGGGGHKSAAGFQTTILPDWIGRGGDFR